VGEQQAPVLVLVVKGGVNPPGFELSIHPAKIFRIDQNFQSSLISNNKSINIVAWTHSIKETCAGKQ
jgi:hypothetical protein